MYQLTCNSCNQQYIGSTTRFIHDRVKKHLFNENSSVKKHIYSCHNKDYKGIEVKIIVSEKDPANLRLYEAFYISYIESASLHSIPRKNVVNSQTFYFSILFQRPFLSTFRGPLSRDIPLSELCIPFTVFFIAFIHTPHLLHISPYIFFAYI